MKLTQLLNASKYLITGGLGQLGGRFAAELGKRHGAESVILSDCKSPNNSEIPKGVKFEQIDVTNINKIKQVVDDNGVTCVIHLAALLSSIAEQKPQLAVDVNVNTIYPILNLAKEKNLKVFIPSTIGAFGPESPRSPTPDVCIQKPKSIYGIAKVYAELFGEYFNIKHGVDFRSLRYPGIISSDSEPGGGTTDYAIHIFQKAILDHKYTCYLTKDTMLPMMHIDDCIINTVNFIDAPSNLLKQRIYNIGAVSFTPEQLTNEIKKHIPDFKIDYNIDPVRQGIADSWPRIFEDSNARNDWGHNPTYNTESITRVMLDDMKAKYAKNLN